MPWLQTPLTLRAPFADAGTKKNWKPIFGTVCCFTLTGAFGFERYCYGEAACLVFSLWANGLDETGKILWVKEPEFEVDQKAIPRVITDVQENGTAMQADNQRKRYVKTEEFDEDKPNGYGRFQSFSAAPQAEKALRRAGVPAHLFILFTFISKRNCPRRTVQSGTSGGNFYLFDYSAVGFCAVIL